MLLNTIHLNRMRLNAIGKVGSIHIANGNNYEDLILQGIDVLFIEDAVENSISQFKLNGGAIQKGTPTPSAPLSIISNRGEIRYGVIGNNLLDIRAERIVNKKYLNNNGTESSSAANFYVAQFIKVDAGGTYTASVNEGIGYFSYMEYDANFGFLKRTLYGSGTSSKMTEFPHTMSADTAYVVVGSNPTSAENTVEQILEYEWMFNKGATALPYEPYRAGFIIGGEDSVRVCGKNLNAGTLDYQGYTSTGGTSSSTTFCGTLHKISVIEGQKYTVSFGDLPDGASGVFVNTWYRDGRWNMRQAISSSGKLTYTIPEGIGYVNFTLYKTGGITIDENSWMQVELGSEATSYEPYDLYSTAVAELLLSTGAYTDEQDILKGIVTRRTGIKVFDGTENMSISSGTFNYGVGDKLKKASPVLCTHYPYTSVSASSAPDKVIKSYASQNIGFKDADYGTLAEFSEFLAKQYAKGTPVIVVYPLLEEVVDNVAPQPMPNPMGDFYIIRSMAIPDITMEVHLKREIIIIPEGYETLVDENGYTLVDAKGQIIIVPKGEESGDNDAPSGNNIIKFTVNGYDEEFTAEEGMTWYDWCQSAYNKDGWTCDGLDSNVLTWGNYVSQWDYEYFWVMYNGTTVLGSDAIIPNGNYVEWEDSFHLGGGF